jgi:hypothetical protein
VEEVDSSENSPLAGSPDYVVQSPSESPLHESVPLEDENLEVRYSSRTLGVNLENAMDRATKLTKKRNLQDTCPPSASSNSFSVLSNLEIISRVSDMGLIFLITILTLWTFFERWNLLGIVLLKKSPLMLSLLLIYIFKMEMVIKSLCVQPKV